jgi:fused signal recognition particle receptor
MADTVVGKLRARLNRGDSWLTRDLGDLFRGETLRPDAIEEFEERLLLADAGVEATDWLCEKLRAAIRAGRIRNEAQLRDELRKALLELLRPARIPSCCSSPASTASARPPPSASWHCA